MTISLSPRLAALAALVPEGSAAADVGAGHGRLAAELARTGRCRRVVVIDISPSELDASTARRAGLDLRCGDGLGPLRPEDRVETVIVAGLGGASIARIISSRPEGLSIQRWILQPQTEAALLRSCLPSSGLALVAERLVEDGGRSYPILVASPAPAPELPAFPGLTREDVLEAGPFLLRDRPPELASAWSRQRARLAGLSARGGRVAEALARAERILAYLATSAPGG